jgi:hypothetical protein
VGAFPSNKKLWFPEYEVQAIDNARAAEADGRRGRSFDWP